ncbi:hypothetical protein ABKN59_006897 [Abortiporus biennis]
MAATPLFQITTSIPPFHIMNRTSSTRSTSLRRPHEIFTISPPSPPQRWTTTLSQLPTGRLNAVSVTEYKKVEGLQKTLHTVLHRFQGSLRNASRRMIRWPDEVSLPPDTTPSQYLKLLLEPIADLFNQLHTASTLQTPVEYIEVNLGNSMSGITFTAYDFRMTRVTSNTPLVLYIPYELFDSDRLSLAVQHALSKSFEYNPRLPCVIVTNFKETTVCFPPVNGTTGLYEKIITNHPIKALQVVTGAYLYRFLPLEGTNYIKCPDRDLGYNTRFIHPEGPRQDPNRPLDPDEKIFATHHRFSDFDRATLVRDNVRAAQFLRWYHHVAQKYTKLVAHPGDILHAKTNETGAVVLEHHLRPVYPFRVSQLPPETAEYVNSIRRESPLSIAELSESLKNSRSFAVKIEDVLSEGSAVRGICTVYRCKIIGIDGIPISSSPLLCLKLFDDRFQKLEQQDEEEPDADAPHLFLSRSVIAEEHALKEARAYDTLRPVQGSLVPWFYGLHQFTLPDGLVLCGVLMEYINGRDLHSGVAQNLDTERQITLVKSCRHAARVLDIADINQLDWHNGQVLLYTNPETNIDQYILIDFAFTEQTWSPLILNWVDNYFGMLGALQDVKTGLDLKLIWRHYGDPDEWDPLIALIPVSRDSEEMKKVQAQDLFTYISTDPF